MLKRIRALLGGRGSKATEDPTSEKIATPAPARSRTRVHRGPKVVRRPIPESDLDPDAVKIIRRLTRFDHRAYLVGGCVRDLLLERHPKDFDIGTSATPRQVKRLFRNCRIIGRRFRLAHIYFQNGKIIEVATFRALDSPDPADPADLADTAEAIDPADEDLLIRDDNVFGTPEEDALRRDFTINQLFYDMADETVIDHADGLVDLRRKLVRSIGDPEIRFREDPIRCLRAIKFAARLDLEIEGKTLAALRKTRNEIPKAAAPRILEELIRFCRGGAARASFELMRSTEVLETVLPQLAREYAKTEEAWSLMLDLLRRMDSWRFGQAREIRIGEMFAALFLPLLAPKAGWKADGTVEIPRELNVRDLVDEFLRPTALDLRVPRREQEYCRQILGTFFRLVPARKLRRNSKRAILRRESMADTIWMLDVMADRFGGDVAEALEYWTQAVEGEVAQSVDLESETPEKTGSSRRRGRRGGRRRKSPERDSEKRETTEGKTEERPARSRSRSRSGRRASREEPPLRADMPPRWDDDYFFAALPDAPEVADTKGSDRYGAEALAESSGTSVADSTGSGTQQGQEAPAEALSTDGEAETPAEGPKPRRRRGRRGGRRRRGARSATDEAGGDDKDTESPGSPEDGGDTDPEEGRPGA